MSSNKVKIIESSFSEEEYGKRIDRCFTDALVKGSGGLLLGATLSLLLFRRRSWPIIMGTGFGVGVAFKNCEKELNSINASPKILAAEIFTDVKEYIFRKNPESNINEEHERKINRCFNDVLVKSVGGFILGTLFSSLFSFRRTWPIFLGTSFGLGAANRNCVLELENTCDTPAH